MSRDEWRGPSGSHGKPVHSWQEDRHYPHTHGDGDPLGFVAAVALGVAVIWWIFWITGCVLMIAGKAGVELPPLLPWL